MPRSSRCVLFVWVVVVTVCAASAKCPVGDLNTDCTVDVEDLKILAQQWLDPPVTAADLNWDDRVDLIDLTLLANNWLQTGVSPTVDWNFTEGTRGWKGNHYVADLTRSRRGLRFTSTGIDPWIEGPAINLPGDRMIRVCVRMKSNADTSGELFYGPYFRAGYSVRFTVHNDNEWHDYDLIIREFLGSGTRFRLDPAASEGQIVVAFIRVETLAKIPQVPLDEPVRPQRGHWRALSVTSGPVTLEHYRGRMGNFVVRVSGTEMAAGYQSEIIGVLMNNEPHWLNFKDAVTAFYYDRWERQIRIRSSIQDSDGGTWQIQRVIRPDSHAGAIVVRTEIQVDADRDVILLPWLTLFPGLGTFDERKDQGLFAGLEYLCDEPSSSEADITTTEHVRRVPDPIKVTFPLIAICCDERYVGLVWEPSEWVAPLFDSPDRIYGSGAHVMAVTGPAVGTLRLENELVAHSPARLAANEPIWVEVTIIGGNGKTVVDPIRQYVSMKALPELPHVEGGFDAAVTLLAHGWLHSDIRHDGLFRHAVWTDKFGPMAAADAPMFMDWLSTALGREQTSLIQQLKFATDQSLSSIPDNYAMTGGVSHVRPPAPPLVFNNLFDYVQKRHAAALAMLDHFDENGIKIYEPGATDYSRTHFANHANGYGSSDLEQILEAATLSAEPHLISEALELLDKYTLLYADTVPRGAQTWEVPLHTPDIVASGRLTKAYVLGYILSGRQEYLQQARYWAWTGVPFVYLVDPTPGPIGRYATIPVFGATNWVGSWFGRPVQWCGLVYCSALHFLSDYDPQGPWRQIASGITASGLQMCWGLEDESRQGLLPDIMLLAEQVGAGPAINPGTVQAHVPELFDMGTIYDIKKAPTTGWFIHAPCAIRNVEHKETCVSFDVAGWGAIDRTKPYYVLISGVETRPAYVQTVCTAADPGQNAGAEAAQTLFDAGQKLLVVCLQGPSHVTVSTIMHREAEKLFR